MFDWLVWLAIVIVLAFGYANHHLTAALLGGAAAVLVAWGITVAGETLHAKIRQGRSRDAGRSS